MKKIKHYYNRIVEILDKDLFFKKGNCKIGKENECLQFYRGCKDISRYVHHEPLTPAGIDEFYKKHSGSKIWVDGSELYACEPVRRK